MDICDTENHITYKQLCCL